jgi:hypothetical protein
MQFLRFPEAMGVPTSTQTAPISRPLNPFALMASRREQGLPKENQKKRSGPKKGSRNQAEHLRLAEMNVVLLPVRFLLCHAVLIVGCKRKRQRKPPPSFSAMQATNQDHEDARNIQKYWN